MKSSKRFSGKSTLTWPSKFACRRAICIWAALLLLISPFAHALHNDFEEGHYTRPALVTVGALTSLYLLSELENAPILFGTAYGIGAVYLMNENYKSNTDIFRYLVPLSLVAVSVMNFSLLNESDDYSSNDVFVYNAIALGAVTAYAMWDHSRPKYDLMTKAPAPNFQIQPVVLPGAAGLIGTFYF